MRCTCSSPSSWEYGPCEYCSRDWGCGYCTHPIDECPEDCYCECNDNIEPDQEEETQ